MLVFLKGQCPSRLLDLLEHGLNLLRSPKDHPLRPPMMLPLVTTILSRHQMSQKCAVVTELRVMSNIATMKS